MSQFRKLFRWFWDIGVVGVVAYCLWGLVRYTRELTPLKAEVERLEIFLPNQIQIRSVFFDWHLKASSRREIEQLGFLRRLTSIPFQQGDIPLNFAITKRTSPICNVNM